jgi:hypothetical protein
MEAMIASKTLANLKPRRGGNPAWKKGVSGNPKGRPKAAYDVAEMCREWTPQAVAALGEALKDPKLKVAAATVLLDRGFGRPRQVIETPEGSSPILLHLAAAQIVSAELVTALEQRSTPPMINGHAEDSSDPLLSPPPTE